MAIWVVDTKNISDGRMQSSFEMDSMDDAANLPPLSDRVWCGSDAFALQEKRLLMLNSDGDWV